jgi:hypothetical protein
MHECDCCKSEVHAVNEHDLCFSCACVQQCAAIIEDETELDANASVDLAMELMGLVRSRILERLLDDGGVPAGIHRRRETGDGSARPGTLKNRSDVDD